MTADQTLDAELLERAIERFERDWKYDGSYMRDIIDASPRAAWLFSRAAALGPFRRDVSIEPWYAAGITAVRATRTAAHVRSWASRWRSVPASVLRFSAVLADDPDAMPPDVALVWKFTRNRSNGPQNGVPGDQTQQGSARWS